MGVVDDAVAAIRSGEPVVLPTDTVYGLCADPHDAEAVARVQRLKGRSETTPIALVAADVETLLALMPELNAPLARALLPGPYTLVVLNPAGRFPWLAAGRPDTIGVRVPELSGPARDVLARVQAVAATSANLHGGRDPGTLADVPEEITAACRAVVDGGELPGVASTVIDLTGPEPLVLREGLGSATDAIARITASS